MRKLLLTASLCLTICACCAQQYTESKTIGPWTYFGVTDAGLTTKMAYTYSQPLNFETGPTSTEMNVSLSRKGQMSIFLSNKNGEFMKGGLGDSIVVRFDDYNLTSWRVAHATVKNDPTTIFIKDKQDFYHALRQSKKVSIRAVFNDGVQWMTFYTKDFSFSNIMMEDANW